MPTGCQWVGCQEFVGPSSLQQSARPFAGVPGSSGGGDGDGDAKPEPAAGQEAAPAAEGAEPMQVDGGSADAPAAEVTADFSRLEAACAQRPAGSPPADAAAALPAAQAAAAAAPDGAAVYCPVMARWTHLRCFPPEVAQQLRESGASRSCPSSDAAAESSHALAAACAAGLISLGEVAEGARAAATAGGAAGGSSGSGAPTPLSLLVVRGAAVAAPADCRGHAPAYSPEQRQQLQVALSAALHVLHRWVGTGAPGLGCPALAHRPAASPCTLRPPPHTRNRLAEPHPRLPRPALQLLRTAARQPHRRRHAAVAGARRGAGGRGSRLQWDAHRAALRGAGGGGCR